MYIRVNPSYRGDNTYLSRYRWGPTLLFCTELQTQIGQTIIFVYLSFVITIVGCGNYYFQYFEENI